MKKIVSMVLALTMLMSVTAFAGNCFPAKDAAGEITYYPSTETIWDLDFEDTKYTLESGGNLTYNSSDKFTTADLQFKTWTTAKGATRLDSVNTITGKNNGRSLVLDASAGPGTTDDKSESRINELQVKGDRDILITEFDFAFNELPTGGDNVVWRPSYNTEATGSTSSNYQLALYLTNEGKLKLHPTTTNVILQANTWYTICEVMDLSNSKVHLYVDGEYVTTGTLNAQYKEVSKINTSTGDNANTNILYYDNINIYEATTNFDLGLALTATSGTTAVEGAPVALTASSDYDQVIERTEILSSTDGINYSVYANGDSAVAYYQSYTTYYKAVAYGSNGDKIDESAPVTLATRYTKANGMQYWDLDFESHTIYQNVLRKSGENINYSPVLGNTFSFYTAAKGSARIDETTGISGASNGKSVIIDASGMTAGSSDGQARLNEIKLQAQCSVLVTEFDFAYNEAPKSNYSIVMRPGMNTTVGGSSSYKFPLYLTKDGKITLNNDNTKAKELQTNRWYKISYIINMTDKKVELYVDGELVNSVTYTEEYVEVFKMQASTHLQDSNTNGNILYYDNLKIYSVAAPSNPELKIEKAEYFIDGAPADQIAAGTLTAKVTLSNNNSANASLSCFAAVYGAGNELVRVDVVPVSFTAAELSKLVELSFGTVVADNTVKIFFWDANSVPNGANKDFE